MGSYIGELPVGLRQEGIGSFQFRRGNGDKGGQPLDGGHGSALENDGRWIPAAVSISFPFAEHRRHQGHVEGLRLSMEPADFPVGVSAADRCDFTIRGQHLVRIFLQEKTPGNAGKNKDSLRCKSPELFRVLLAAGDDFIGIPVGQPSLFPFKAAG